MPRSFLRKSADSSWSTVLWTVAFYGSTSSVAVLVAMRLGDKGMHRVPALLFGAAAGAIGVWFLSWSVWHIAMRLTRGAPFRIGSRVEITSGEHKGTMGVVSGVIEGWYAVRLSLETQPDSECNAIFNWSELRRVSTK